MGHFSRRLIQGLALAATAAALAGCGPPQTGLDDASMADIRTRGALVVLTLEGPTTYTVENGEPAGYEVDLARAFAGYLGLDVRFETRRDIDGLLDSLERGEGHLAAANLTVTPARRDRVTFGPAYKAVTEELICRRGGRAPTRFEDLPGTSIRILAGSSYEETLESLAADHPELRWSARTAGSAMPLLAGVDRGTFDCTVSDSHLADFARRRYPELDVAMELTEERPLAWALNAGIEGLDAALADWFAQAHGDGLLAELDERWFGRFGEFDYVDVAYFVRRVQERLPDYRPAFERAAETVPFDWELLAAQAYQESHWDPDAVSATGVRGLMMLTLSTAERVGIEDRTDPYQSIEGGTAYLAELYERVPEEVTGEDRIWFALAAYNVGMGHMYDARALAERLGRDKNAWNDLAATLPLLSDPAYYQTLRYGYARGHEPVRYVEKIREYRTLLDAQGL
ncbi:membrane-bound lytic murein transglycosylase MltF [Maricaulis sp.]|uniref:membrane-bound lytic murein transglycosylase MltF n=1 Tax=Maricaulis sp. TaxID=1486257 RepID=UPI002615F04C|nr:membrane-bound lytic murein transglycosylase MltF [Maricaulis sp.]